MKKKSFWKAIAAISVAGLTVFSQSSSGDQSAIRLAISSAKRQWLVGEPVVLQVTLTNTSQSAEEVLPQLQKEVGLIHYFISNDNREYRRVTPYLYRDPSKGPVSLAPNESLYHEETLIYNPIQKDLLFPSAGRYYVRAEWHQTRPVQSNVLEIEIVPPSTALDQKVLEIIRSPQVMVQMAGFANNEDVWNKLAWIAQQDSRYSPYAAFFLASSREKPAEALQLLAKADVQDFPLRSQVVYKKARTYLAMGENEKAREQLNRLRSEFRRHPTLMDIESPR
jgi:hypothetical protein